jgi:molecular chaperone DnaJ
VTPDDRFVRDGDDLVHRLDVSVAQAALGAQLDLETLDGVEDLPIPRGTQTGRTFRLRGRGVPHLQGRGRGDLVVVVNVVTPTDLTEEEASLLERFAALRGEQVGGVDESLFSRLRSRFS